MPKEETSILDAKQVADLVGLDRGQGAVFAGFVRAFLAGAEGRLRQLQELAGAGESRALADGAHALRGSAGNVGAARLAGVLERLEGAAKRGDLAAAHAEVAHLDAEYALARDALLAAVPPKS